MKALSNSLQVAVFLGLMVGASVFIVTPETLELFGFSLSRNALVIGAVVSASLFGYLGASGDQEELEKEIQGIEGVNRAWEVRVNGVHVGWMSNAEYAAIKKQVGYDGLNVIRAFGAFCVDFAKLVGKVALWSPMVMLVFLSWGFVFAEETMASLMAAPIDEQATILGHLLGWCALGVVVLFLAKSLSEIALSKADGTLLSGRAALLVRQRLGEPADGRVVVREVDALPKESTAEKHGERASSERL